MGRKGGRERSERLEEKYLTARENEKEERSGRDIEIMSFFIYLSFFSFLLVSVLLNVRYV